MADFVFNIAKGAVAKRVRDDPTKIGVMLLKANEAEASLKDRNDLAALLAEAGNTEADFTNYARKFPITGTLTQDDAGDKVDVDIPNQTFSNAGGATNNTLTKLITYYEDGAADSTRVPLTGQDFAATTDGNDLNAIINTQGFYTAG